MKLLQTPIMKKMALPLTVTGALAVGSLIHQSIVNDKNEFVYYNKSKAEFNEGIANEFDEVVLRADTIEMNEALKAYNSIDTANLFDRYNKYQEKLKKLQSDVENAKTADEYRLKKQELNNFVENNKSLQEYYNKVMKLRNVANGRQIQADIYNSRNGLEHIGVESFKEATFFSPNAEVITKCRGNVGYMRDRLAQVYMASQI